MKNLVVGFIAGVLVSAGIYFFLHPDPAARIYLGRRLDEDVIYLNNGTVFRGWIIDENGSEIMLETDSGHMSIPVKGCRLIEENQALKYIREAV